jgi:hypothetical protein
MRTVWAEGGGFQLSCSPGGHFVCGLFRSAMVSETTGAGAKAKWSVSESADERQADPGGAGSLGFPKLGQV